MQFFLIIVKLFSSRSETRKKKSFPLVATFYSNILLIYLFFSLNTYCPKKTVRILRVSNPKTREQIQKIIKRTKNLKNLSFHCIHFSFFYLFTFPL